MRSCKVYWDTKASGIRKLIQVIIVLKFINRDKYEKVLLCRYWASCWAG